jgi:hypothetical protein
MSRHSREKETRNTKTRNRPMLGYCGSMDEDEFDPRGDLYDITGKGNITECIGLDFRVSYQKQSLRLMESCD